ncbi:Fc receptor-like protein 4 [Nycticebus coucang]|uniref:Fc receptor-like protein 4 n=1 Tax=Nycticebus coucang TaxID=9470 RepID=UPI00234D1ACD|nr:Fc receptor-like protein 4 [Nycticebus coucang]
MGSAGDLSQESAADEDGEPSGSPGEKLMSKITISQFGDGMFWYPTHTDPRLRYEMRSLRGSSGRTHLPIIYPRTRSARQETAHKPVISLQPPWTTVFQGDTVTLTCNGFHLYPPQKTKWKRRYSRKEIETPGNTLEVREPGEYSCQTGDSPLSNPVRLSFSSGPFILQIPYSVFEGDTLVLRCQRRGKEKLNSVKYVWNSKTLSASNESWDLLIPQASSKNDGTYQCIGFESKNAVFRSNSKVIKVQELFPLPKLKATVFQPTEGSSVNLSCETQLSPERSDTPLYFIFFRDNGGTLSNRSRSPEFQIPTIWSENSGFYWCGTETETCSVSKYSPRLQIRVQRIPVSGVLMETQPPGGQAIEGETLVLICSVAEGTGDTTFSWHREDTESLGRKTQRSQRAELEIPVVRKSHSGRYYCSADNSYGSVQSRVVNITVAGTSGNRSSIAVAGSVGSLCSTLLLAVTLLFCWHRRKSGDDFQRNETRSLPTPGWREPSHSVCPVQVELWPLNGNVHPEEGDLVYSEIQTLQLGEGREASHSSPSTAIFLSFQHGSVVYSEVKTQLPDNSAGNVHSKDEDIMEHYENVQRM